MRGNMTKNRGISLLLAIVILATTFLLPAPSAVAASKYITINAFIKQLVQSIKLEVDTTADTSYIDAAQKAGIIKTSDFKKYTANITRTDAAVFLNRADEYLHGNTMDSELLKVIIEKRISDINKITQSKREAVANIYGKGIITGYSNGNYTQNRAFKGSTYLTISDAKIVINSVINSKSRAKISPDGQLIRTTNLPKNASNYEYILASFPNKFYEKKFEFEETDQFMNGTLDDESYAYPAEMRTEMFETWYKKWKFSIEMGKYLYDWQEKVDVYLNYIFNVDYRTVDNQWIEGLGAVYTRSNLDMPEVIKRRYVDKMKKNKVVIESSLISIEPSTLYFDAGYRIRAYIRYRITAKDIKADQNELIFTPFVYLKNLKSGEWRTGYFDIQFDSNDPFNGDGFDFAISYGTNLLD